MKRLAVVLALFLAAIASPPPIQAQSADASYATNYIVNVPSNTVTLALDARRNKGLWWNIFARTNGFDYVLAGTSQLSDTNAMRWITNNINGVTGQTILPNGVLDSKTIDRFDGCVYVYGLGGSNACLQIKAGGTAPQ